MRGWTFMENNSNTAPDSNEQGQQPQNKSVGKKTRRKRKNSAIRVVLKFVIWIIVIALVIFLTLFLSARIAEFDSIGDMLDYIRGQF